MMSEKMAFTNEEIGELIEFLRKEGLDPCDDAADLIESQAAELSALRERVKELEGMIEKVDDLISESVGVEGLHMNGDIATWEWLKNNEWLDGFDALLSTGREEG